MHPFQLFSPNCNSNVSTHFSLEMFCKFMQENILNATVLTVHWTGGETKQ